MLGNTIYAAMESPVHTFPAAANKQDRFFLYREDGRHSVLTTKV